MTRRCPTADDADPEVRPAVERGEARAGREGNALDHGPIERRRAVASVELGAAAAGSVALGVGASVVTTVIASGVILSAAGEVLCFIPNAIGRALLYNEKIL